MTQVVRYAADHLAALVTWAELALDNENNDRQYVLEEVLEQLGTLTDELDRAALETPEVLPSTTWRSTVLETGTRCFDQHGGLR